MPRRPSALAVMLALVLSAAGPAAAQEAADTVCRGTALGGTTCAATAPRPEPRPPNFEPPRGLDAVRVKPDPDLQAPTLIPARRTNSFGQTRLGPGDGGLGGPCRRDALGNLHCR